MSNTISPIEMVVLQGTPYCNLNCSYCDLSPESRAQRHQMPLETIDRIFRDIFVGGWAAPKISVVWHSGEPLTLPPSYYQSAIDRILELRDALAEREIQLSFDFQTNGVLINDAWIDFFKSNKHHMRLGLSCDGPEKLHDAYRLNLGGRGTHAKVSAAMQRLSDNDIPFKVIAVVTDETLADPDSFFDYFSAQSQILSGFHFNVLADGTLAGQQGLTYSRGDRDRYYRFYRRLLDKSRAVVHAGGTFRIQNFAQAMDRVINPHPSSMTEASRPLRTINVDAHGAVTTFYAGLDRSTFKDHYGDGQGLALGNINTRSIKDMVATPKFRRICADFQRSQENCRKSCAYCDLCPGGFELSQLSEHKGFDGAETAECLIIVKTLMDAVLEDVSEYVSAERGVA